MSKESLFYKTIVSPWNLVSIWIPPTSQFCKKISWKRSGDEERSRKGIVGVYIELSSNYRSGTEDRSKDKTGDRTGYKRVRLMFRYQSKKHYRICLLKLFNESPPLSHIICKNNYQCPLYRISPCFLCKYHLCYHPLESCPALESKWEVGL